MKTCCLVWEIPVIEGEHYNPIMNVIYMQKAKKFLNQLNRYFQDENMDWKCVLDRSACTYNEIFSSENQAVIFAPEAKTRQWLYKKEIQDESIPKYYLDFAEYNEGKNRFPCYGAMICFEGRKNYREKKETKVKSRCGTF